MSNDKETSENALADDKLSASYRAVAVESAPARLDAEILNRARLHARKSGARILRSGWLRPAVFVATAGLSLAVILELGEVGVLESAPEPPSRDAGRFPVGGSDREMQAPGPSQEAAATSQAVRDSAELTAPAGTAGAAAKLRSRAEVAAFSASNEPAAPATRFCSEEQIRSPETWWQCIESLNETGQQEAARQEANLLQEAYPDFLPAR